MKGNFKYQYLDQALVVLSGPDPAQKGWELKCKQHEG